MFSKITEAIAGIRLELGAVSKAIRQLSERPTDPPPYGDMPERLSTLEGRLAAALGEIDAGILKAEALKGAARASEERGRGHMKRAEAALEATRGIDEGEESDPFERVARAYQDLIPQGNGEASEGAGMQPMYSGVEGRRQSRALARASKRR